MGRSSSIAPRRADRWASRSPRHKTVNNVVNLSRDHKPVVVFVAPTRQFRTVKTFDDLKDLLALGDPDSVERIVSELHLESHRAAG